MEATKRPGRDMAIRKRIWRRAERELAGSHLAPQPWRWVHGVLYAANGRAVATQSSGAFGLDGLQKREARPEQCQPQPARREKYWWERES